MLFRSLLLAISFVYVVAVKFTRGSDTVLAPEWLAGVMPNLVCGIAIPFVVFVSNRVLKYSEFLLFASLIVLGLIGYEFFQLVKSHRTFDWDDIVASIVGGAIAVLIGTVFFRESITKKVLL